MPDVASSAFAARLGAFGPRALRIPPDERRLVEELTERVLAIHPAWPWPLIEEEARRLANEVLTLRDRGDRSA